MYLELSMWYDQSISVRFLYTEQKPLTIKSSLEKSEIPHLKRPLNSEVSRL